MADAVAQAGTWNLHQKPPPVSRKRALLGRAVFCARREGDATQEGAGRREPAAAQAAREWVEGQGLEQLRTRPHTREARAFRGWTPCDRLPVRGREERHSPESGVARRVQHRVACRVQPTRQDDSGTGLKPQGPPSLPSPGCCSDGSFTAALSPAGSALLTGWQLLPRTEIPPWLPFPCSGNIWVFCCFAGLLHSCATDHKLKQVEEVGRRQPQSSSGG